MSSICFYFQVHQPERIKDYRIFDVGSDHAYFNDRSDSDLNNRRVLKKVVNKSYLPANKRLLQLLNDHPEFKLSFSFSGILLEQLEQHAPKALQSFQDLVDTGRVELLSETYYHSLSFLHSNQEYREQIEQHRNTIQRLFGQTPDVLRNTELVYSNELGKKAVEMGFKGLLAEGADRVLGWRSPNFVYRPKNVSDMKLLVKNYQLSDDIAFRFSNEDWEEYPLTASKFAHWIDSLDANSDVINLFMDYETFGEHQWADSGIFDFMETLPAELLSRPDNDFVTPSEAMERYEAKDELDYPELVSWADTERDLSAWLENDMQHEAMRKLYELEEDVRRTNDEEILEDWRKLQTSDHFYYMCTKWFDDGDVHKYFNPYETPYDAYMAFMNVLRDLQIRIWNSTQDRQNKQTLESSFGSLPDKTRTDHVKDKRNPY